MPSPCKPGIVETRSFMAPDLGESGGASVAAGDGLIVLGAGAGDGSRVVVLRYADEGTVLKFDAYTGFDGGVRVALGNLAGTPTIETGSGPGARTHVKVFRRIDLALLGSTYIGEPDDFGGAYVG